MKKYIKYLILIFILVLIPNNKVLAAGYISPSTTSINMVKGESKTFSVNANNAAGQVLIQSNNSSVASVNTSSYFFDTSLGSSSVSVTVTAHNAGSTTISIILDDVGTFDGEELTGTKIINVNVSDPAPQPDPEPEKPSEPEPVQPSQPQNNNNYNNNSNTKQTETKKEEKQEEKKEEEIKKEEKKVEKEKLKISKFYVVGYDINFRQDKLDYTIDIDDSLKAIYIVVAGENLEITGDKEVNIVGKNRVAVRLKSGNTIEEYTIKLNRKVKEEEKKENNLTPIFIGTTAFFALTTIGLGTYIIIKKKRTA